MGGVKLSAKAESDLVQIWTYLAIESGNITTADKFIDDLRGRLFKLAEFPELGRERPEIFPEIRSFAFSGYVIFYQIRNDQTLIARVLHGSRDMQEIFSDPDE